MSNLINFKNSILIDGGASYNLLTGEFNPNDGYMVSIKGHELVTPYNPLGLQYDIAQYIKQKADILISGITNDKFIGAWVYDDNLYLDVSVKLQDRADAEQLARDNEQIAFFDCNSGTSIKL